MENIKEWLLLEPNTEDVYALSEGVHYIPIDTMEKLLDEFTSWGTQNFKYLMFKDGYSNPCVAASIELVVEYEGVKRTMTGACNFSLKSLYPNSHFLATAKSECVKNAASDLGKRLGRGLNAEVIPDKENEAKATGDVVLHDSIEQFKIKADAAKK